MILLRHGQSEFNVIYSVTRVDPGIPDPELTALGREQAAAAAQTLADRDLARVVSSPYIRAIQTAEIVAEILDLAITIELVHQWPKLFRLSGEYKIDQEIGVVVCIIGENRRSQITLWPATSRVVKDRC